MADAGKRAESLGGSQGVEPSLERRFRGSVRLVTLHLWRVAASTDVDQGFKVAKQRGMLTAEHEAFVRSCFALDMCFDSGQAPTKPITAGMVKELQKCAIRLNTADSA